MNGPPRVGRRLLSVVVRPDDRRFLLEDLDEEFRQRWVTHGAGVARRWYWAQVRRSVWPSARRRVECWSRARSRSSSRKGSHWMDRFAQDVRFAVRMLSRRPGYAFTAVITLAIGIGANTAIFSVVNGVLFKDVPGIADTERLVAISRDVGGEFFDVSYPAFTDLRTGQDVLDDMAAMTVVPVAIGVDGESRVHTAMAVSGNYFSVLGAAPDRGRFFAPAESFFPAVTPAIVISHRLWRQRFGPGREAVGETVTINGVPMVVLGVTPEGFGGHVAAVQFDAFFPLGVAVPGTPTERGLRDPNTSQVELIGRLRIGATVEEAAVVLTGLADRYNQSQNPSARSGQFTVRVDPWSPVPAVIQGGVTAFFGVLLGIVTLVLAITCVNVANMSLARSTERRTEIALRLAMGAARGRIVRQLVTESLVVFGAAAVVGMLASVWVTGLLLSFQPPLPWGLSLALDFGLDWRVLSYAVAVSLAAGVIFSLAPAIHATRPDLVPALKDEAASGAPTPSRLRNLLVATQMAVTMVLLVTAGLFLRALRSMDTIDTGWEVDGVHTMSLDLRYSGVDATRGNIFYRELLDRVTALPGIDAAGLAAKLPLAGRSSFGNVNVSGMAAPDRRFGFAANLNRISPGYFSAVGLQLLDGRDVGASDIDGQPLVAVINEAMARRLWPDRDVVGSRFYLGRVGEGRAIEVVGVVENAKYNRLVEETPNFYYVSAAQWYTADMTLHVRTAAGVGPPGAAVREAVRALDPVLPAPFMTPLAESLDVFLLPQRIGAWVTGVMGAVGLLLGAVGVYGVTAFAIGQRRREIGVRLALGARRGEVVGLMMRQGIIAPGAGLLVGLGMALALSRVLTQFLGSVSALDPTAFAGMAVVLIGVSGLATLLPARRAARLDPVVTLRTE